MKTSLILAFSLSLIHSSPLFGPQAGSQDNGKLSSAKPVVKSSEIKPLENTNREAKAVDNSLIDLKVKVNGLGAKSNDSDDPPPIESIFDQDLWNSEKDKYSNIPIGFEPDPSQVPSRPKPPQLPGDNNNNNGNGKNPSPSPQSPPSQQSPYPIPDIPGADKIKKTALEGFSSIFSPIRPIFHTLDTASHTSMENFSEFSDQIPVLNELVNSSKGEGLRNVPGYLQFRNVMDSLILAGDMYKYKS